MFILLQGSDPRAVTCRGKLQSRRCKLNQEINKELRLRAGAENLYKVNNFFFFFELQVGDHAGVLYK